MLLVYKYCEGEIYYSDYPSSEDRHYVMILQNRQASKDLQSLMVVPLTSREPRFPECCVKATGLLEQGKASYFQCHNVTSLKLPQIGRKKIGVVPDDLLKMVQNVIYHRVMLGDIGWGYNDYDKRAHQNNNNDRRNNNYYTYYNNNSKNRPRRYGSYERSDIQSLKNFVDEFNKAKESGTLEKFSQEHNLNISEMFRKYNDAQDTLFNLGIIKSKN